MKIAIFDEKVIKPFEFLGLKSNFWGVNIETLIYTWVGMLIMFVLVLVASIYLRKKINPVALIFEKSVSFFDNLCKESFGSKFKYEYFCFVSTIFFFTLFACTVGLLPFLEEAAKDLNTAFAIGTLSFVYVQYQIIKVHGVVAYLKELHSHSLFYYR